MVKHSKLLIAIAIIFSFFLIKPGASNAADVVNPKLTYTYDTMVGDIKELAQKYPDIITYKIIGSSEYKRPIYAVSLGTGNANVFINGSHHAREWISTTLNMYMLEQYAKMYAGNQTFGGYHVKKVLDETTIWFVPMVNPDGVTLQQFGLSKFPSNVHSSLNQMNNWGSNFEKWKANAKGVDLNRQYSAGWSTIKNNRTYPSWSHHKGYKPEQATETKTLVKFTAEIDPEMAISYHTSGEVLYWNYNQTGQQKTRDQIYAKRISQYTGYSLVNPQGIPSGGGYTDWFISKYKRPAFTPELGKYAGDTHVPLKEFDRIWSQNRYIGLYTASEGYKLYIARGGQPKLKEVNVKIDGNLIQFTQPALLTDGGTVVPVRGVFEHLGAIVDWHQETKTVTARKGTTFIELKVGSKTMKVNGASRTLDVAPLVMNNHTMIPLRAVSEALGAEVGWDPSTTTALITSPPVVIDETPPSKPTVDPVTDVTLKVKGTSEVNAEIVIKNGDLIVGKSKVNENGQFTIEISVQKSDTVLSVTATDLAGNTSEATEVIVAYTRNFTDTVGHWAEDSIGFLKDRGITNGLPDGSFGVLNNISRAEAAIFIANALQLDVENIEKPNLTDVHEHQYFYPYVAAVYQEGVMQGKTEGQFDPEDTLTRAEMAEILVNAYQLESKDDRMFPDVQSSHWAFASIQTLFSNGITKGYPDGTFRANNPITRSEFASLLAEVIKLEEAQGDEQTQTNEEEISESPEEGASNTESTEPPGEADPSESPEQTESAIIVNPEGVQETITEETLDPSNPQ